MSRDQRARDNWALLFAQQLALETKQPLAVVFCLVPQFLDAAIRQYSFMLRGLRQVETALEQKNISFNLLLGEPARKIPIFVNRLNAGALVTDFDPLRTKRAWKQNVCDKIRVAFYEVDAHNIVPCWLASDKQEYGAYTIRPKLRKKLPEFLESFPRLKRHPFRTPAEKIDWPRALRSLKVSSTPSALDWITPGENAARKMLDNFIKNRLASYSEKRNDPNSDGQSNLSPYLHFGHIAPQRVALEITKADAPAAAKEPFLEELIIRRELADNFCFYNKNYDSTKAFPHWAKRTLAQHKKDRRQYLYTIETLEHAQTHDQLWNAAQSQMLARGKTHGYLRMYWCKKILEWTGSPDQAVAAAIYLNDKYELDGRDPNGYAGIAWSIGGVHDRAWPQRKIFGKIRYMSYNGCKAKFDIEKYILATKTTLMSEKHHDAEHDRKTKLLTPPQKRI
jgi:deoxyribodipyrimidine photo-lyase